MQFKSLPQLLDYFKEEETGIKYYEQLRWNGNPVCPHCGAEKPYKTTRGYKCSNNECYKKFTVKIGTIFENSKLPFRIWFAAIFLANGHKKGISSVQLATDLGITQRTAWFMLHRIRETLKVQAPNMVGELDTVEADETFIGGKERNRHTKKRQSDVPGVAKDGTPYNEKKIVAGIIERGGKVILRRVPSRHADHLIEFIMQHVPVGASVNTDELSTYKMLKTLYNHVAVNHSARSYVNGKAHTNTMENFWSVLKRGMYGTYHQVSEKHFERYLAEFSTRFNSRFLTVTERFDNSLIHSRGSLMYKELISEKRKI